MTKNELVVTARALIQPPSSAVDEFSAKREQLVTMVNRSIRERPDLEGIIGAGNESMLEDNNRNFSRFMESIFYHYEPEVLVETVMWVFRTYRSHGFKPTFWPVNLNTWAEVLKKQLSEETYIQLFTFYDWLRVNIPVFVKLTDGPHT